MAIEKRILTINDWKTFKGKSAIKEEIVTIEPETVVICNTPEISPEIELQVNDVVVQAKDIGLPKLATIEYVKNIFTDTTKAPEEISVSFVRNWLNEIEKGLNAIPGPEWPKDDEFLEIQELMKNAEPAKDWMLFKLDETKVANNESKYVYFNDASKITEEISNRLKNKGAKIIYQNAKWINSLTK